MIKIRKHKTGQENSKMNLSTPKDVKKKSPNKKVKPSNRKLDGEKFLDSDKISTKGYRKPISKKIDGEKFLSKDLEVKKFESYIKEEIQEEESYSKSKVIELLLTLSREICGSSSVSYGEISQWFEHKMVNPKIVKPKIGK